MLAVFFWLIFLVSSTPSMTTLRFLHFSSMNTTFSKSSQFSMSSVAIPIAFMNAVSPILFHTYLVF